MSLSGGVALARAGERAGLRGGYGASIAALLDTVAILGATRLGGPVTQAPTAPLLGRMHARGARPLWQTLACAALRVAYNGVTTVFFIWVIVGGLPAYAGTYDSVLARIPGVPAGPLAALVVTALVIVGWAAAASVIQVQIFGRALRRWPVVGATAAPLPRRPLRARRRRASTPAPSRSARRSRSRCCWPDPAGGSWGSSPPGCSRPGRSRVRIASRSPPA